MTQTDDTKAMRDAVAAYDGPVTQCPPGKKPKRRKWKVWSKTVKQRPTDPRTDAGWQHDDGGPDPKEQRRQQRMAHAQRQRIAKRNTAMRKQIKKRA
jgi:hypothetical protein